MKRSVPDRRIFCHMVSIYHANQFLLCSNYKRMLSLIFSVKVEISLVALPDLFGYPLYGIAE